MQKQQILRIREPLRKWPAIGIRNDRLGDTIELVWKDRFGDRCHPGQFRVNQEKIPEYSHMYVGPFKDIELTIVPIEDLIPIETRR